MTVSNQPPTADSLRGDILDGLDAVRREGTDLSALVAGLPGTADRQVVVEALRELERRGEVVEWNQRWYRLRYTNWVAGRLEIQRGGQAVVRSGERGEPGFSVRRGDLNGARDGDLVLVKARRGGRGRGRQRHQLPEATVAKILERRWTELVGRVVPWHSGHRLEPFERRARLDVELREPLPDGVHSGDYVVAELLESPGRGGSVAARVTEVLGGIDKPGVDVEVILRAYEIPDEFPLDVVESIADLPSDPEASDFEGRLDLRDATLVTIDAASARDFDDAISVETGPDGGFRLGVHIADVSHYVGEGSRLDREAYRRGTSVYFPDRAVPMLPEALSNGLCSLRPDVPRLTLSALLDFAADGSPIGRSFAVSVIRSRRRLTYSIVRRLLEEPSDGDEEEFGDVLPMLRRAEALRRLLYERRLEDGSIDLDLPEARIVLDDETGQVEEIVPAERTISHRLIEELMIAANRAVAAELEGAEAPSPHRVHAPPELETLEELRTGLAAIGLEFPVSRQGLSPEAFQAVLRRAHGEPQEALVSSLILRAMQRAVYSPVGGGHFALSLPEYTHFTSPIRRYPDLLVHRALKRHLAGLEPPADLSAQLPAIAAWCSTTERRAERAERELRLWKKVRFLEPRVGEGFTGTITGVQPFGLFVQLDGTLVDGLIPIRTMTDDFYHFEPDLLRLIGESSKRVFRLGDSVDVMLTKADIASRQLDFEVQGMPPPRRRPRSRRPRSVY